MTPPSPAFAAALSAVSALLGPADATDDDLACWGVRGGVNLALRYHDDADIVLTAERPNGDARTWTAIGDATVRDACAWLSWEVPRPDINALLDARDARRRAPAGYDGDGRLATDDGCAETFDDYPTDAA